MINIDYSWHEIDVYSEPVADCTCAEPPEQAPDINPEDLEASDSVTFTWSLV